MSWISCEDSGGAQSSRGSRHHGLADGPRGRVWPHLLQIHVLGTAQQDRELATTRLAQRDHHNEVVPVERASLTHTYLHAFCCPRVWQTSSSCVSPKPEFPHHLTPHHLTPFPRFPGNNGTPSSTSPLSQKCRKPPRGPGCSVKGQALWGQGLGEEMGMGDSLAAGEEAGCAYCTVTGLWPSGR